MGINSRLLLPGTLGGQAGSSGSAEAAAFLARTSGLDGTHIAAYQALIDGLVADGVWSLFDAFYVFATQDATTAGLNLVSTSFTITGSGSPAFTADRGYLGGTLDSNLDASGAAKFTQDSAHLSVWNTDGASSSQPTIGNSTVAGGLNLYGTFGGDGKFYSRINDAVETAGYAVAANAGHYIGNRSSSSAVQAYKNGSSAGSASQASKAVPSATIQFSQATAIQLGAGSVGSSMSSTDAGNFYARLRTFMTAVGAP